MKIGIIVYSQTGNTHSVALKLNEKLTAAGHSVNMERLMPVGDPKPGDTNVKFEKLPDLNIYDCLVFGAPVQAFSLCSAMKSYLSQIAPLNNKKVACLTTEAFPYKWMGGSRAIAQMKKLCESKSGIVCGTGIVNWSNKQREKMIVDVVEKLASQVIKG